MSAATGLASSGILEYSMIGSARQRLTAQQRRCLSDVVWALNSHLIAVARGRVPVVDILYPPSLGGLGSRQVH
jgi:hypothetical protein